MKRIAFPLIWTCAAAVVAAVAMVPAAYAEEPSIVGKWKIEVDMGGTPVPADMEVIEAEDGTLKAKISSVQGEGELEKIEFDGTNISFKQEVQMGESPVVFTFDGTLDGDKVTGTLSSEMGEMPVTGVRAGAEGPGIVGVWSVESDSQLGVLQRVLTINEDMTGTYASEDQAWDISNLNVDGDKVTFDVTVDVQGQQLPLTFEGTLDGNKLTGDFYADGSSVAVVTAKRKGLNLDAFEGQWDLLVASQIGEFNHSITFANDGTTYKSEEGESDVTDIEVDGNEIEFNVTVKAAGADYPLEFTGELDEGKLIGDFWMDGGAVAEVTGTRGGLVAMEDLAGKWNLEVDSPLGLLEHLLIVNPGEPVKYDQDGDVTEAADFNIDEGQIHFGVNIQGYDVMFIGTLEDGVLKGDYHLDGNPVASVHGEPAEEGAEAVEEAEAAQVVE